ncbi:hypothetical protein KAI04_00560 [Candidatus Pacearchaeota archaeon]|nr:hypothetical protein [Candidatus Pacearchaeota archaeon]
MCKNYIDFINKEFKKCSAEEIEIGKTAEFHIKRGRKSLSEIKKELLNCNSLKVANKEKISGETRYTLYFIYTRRKGTRYTITFRGEKIRLITTIPLGKKSIQKAEKKLKKTFKKTNPFNLK